MKNQINKNIKDVILEIFPLSADDSFFEPKFTHNKEAIAAIQEWGNAWKAWSIIDEMLQKDWETTWKVAFENKYERELKAGNVSKIVSMD